MSEVRNLGPFRTLRMNWPLKLILPKEYLGTAVGLDRIGKTRGQVSARVVRRVLRSGR